MVKRFEFLMKEQIFKIAKHRTRCLNYLRISISFKTIEGEIDQTFKDMLLCEAKIGFSLQFPLLSILKSDL